MGIAAIVAEAVAGVGASAATAAVVGTIAEGAVIGAATSGAIAAVTGQNIGKAMITGALTGGIAGPISGAIGSIAPGLGPLGTAVATGAVIGAGSAVIQGGNWLKAGLLGGVGAGIAYTATSYIKDGMAAIKGATKGTLLVDQNGTVGLVGSNGKVTVQPDMIGTTTSDNSMTVFDKAGNIVNSTNGGVDANPAYAKTITTGSPPPTVGLSQEVLLHGVDGQVTYYQDGTATFAPKDDWTAVQQINANTPVQSNVVSEGGKILETTTLANGVKTTARLEAPTGGYDTTYNGQSGKVTNFTDATGQEYQVFTPNGGSPEIISGGGVSTGSATGGQITNNSYVDSSGNVYDSAGNVTRSLVGDYVDASGQVYDAAGNPLVKLPTAPIAPGTDFSGILNSNGTITKADGTVINAVTGFAPQATPTPTKYNQLAVGQGGTIQNAGGQTVGQAGDYVTGGGLVMDANGNTLGQLSNVKLLDSLGNQVGGTLNADGTITYQTGVDANGDSIFKTVSAATGKEVIAAPTQAALPTGQVTTAGPVAPEVGTTGANQATAQPAGPAQSAVNQANQAFVPRGTPNISYIDSSGIAYDAAGNPALNVTGMTVTATGQIVQPGVGFVGQLPVNPNVDYSGTVNANGTIETYDSRVISPTTGQEITTQPTQPVAPGPGTTGANQATAQPAGPAQSAVNQANQNFTPTGGPIVPEPAVTPTPPPVSTGASGFPINPDVAQQAATTSSYNAATGQTTHTYSDGSQIVTDASNNVVTTAPAGTATTPTPQTGTGASGFPVNPDVAAKGAATTTQNADGSTTYHYSDGSTITLGQNNLPINTTPATPTVKTGTGASGFPINSDVARQGAETITTNSDGTTTYHYTDGSTLTLDKSGNVVDTGNIGVTTPTTAPPTTPTTTPPKSGVDAGIVGGAAGAASSGAATPAQTSTANQSKWSWGTPPTIVKPGLNPGYYAQAVHPYYTNTTPIQGQYYWGVHPSAQTPADLVNINNIPGAPAQPWGAAKSAVGGTQPLDINAYIQQLLSPQNVAATTGTVAPVAPVTTP